MSTKPAPTNRTLIRSLLVVGMLLAAFCLYLVIQGSPFARDEPGEAPPVLTTDTSRHVRIRAADGSVVPGTDALVMQDPNKPADVTWHPKVGVLALPEEGGDFRIRVIAPGHRVQDYPAVRGGQTITLTPGLVATVTLRGVPEDGLPEHVRFLLRVKPVELEVQGLPPQTIVDLMDNRGGPGSGPEHIPRGEFGYPLSREQAAKGIVFPAAGRYHIHWGLIDIDQRTWFSLGDACGRELELKDGEAVRAFPMDVTLANLQETLDGLATGVEAAKDMKK